MDGAAERRRLAFQVEVAKLVHQKVLLRDDDREGDNFGQLFPQQQQQQSRMRRVEQEAPFTLFGHVFTCNR